VRIAGITSQRIEHCFEIVKKKIIINSKTKEKGAYTLLSVPQIPLTGSNRKKKMSNNF